MKFSLHYSILLVAATVACVAAAPTTTDPDAIVQEKVLSVAHRLEVESNKFDKEKTVTAQKKTVAEKELEAAQALADKLGGEAATARELATGFKATAEQTRQTVVTSLGDAVNAYTRAKESYEKISGTPELDEEVLQYLKNKYDNALSAIDANRIGRNAAFFSALEADTKEEAADVAKATVARYALSIKQLTEVENEISQKKQALGDCLSPCVNDMECLITSIIGDNIEEPVDEINPAKEETDENEIDPTLTGSDPNQVEEGQVDKDKTGTADEKAKTSDDTDAKDMVDELEVKKKAAEDSKMKVESEEEGEMEDATKIPEQEEQETPEDKAAEKKKLEEIAAEKEKKEKRVKDAAREAAKKKADEVAEEEKASEKVNKNKKDKAAKKDEEAKVVAEEGEATKKGEMKGEDETVQEETAGENDETKGVDKTVQEETTGENDETKGVDKTVQEEKVGETVPEKKAGESGVKNGEDKTKNAVVQDSGAKFNQPAVAVGILSVMFALAFGV